jgi:hypothetical protein
MLYKIHTNKLVEKFIFSHPEIGKRFFDKTDVLVGNPFDKSLDTKPLK